MMTIVSSSFRRFFSLSIRLLHFGFFLWRGQIFVYALRGVDHIAFVHR